MIPALKGNGKKTNKKKVKATSIMTVAEYVQACRNGVIPKAIIDFSKRGKWASDVLFILNILQATEPLQGIRPGVANLVSTVQKVVSVPRAPSDEGDDGFSSVRALMFCAPMEQTLIVRRLRVQPANLTATENGTVEYKQSGIPGFDGICTPYDEKTKPGTLVSVENVVLCPGAGFDVYVQNFSRTSEALFKVSAQVWGAE